MSLKIVEVVSNNVQDVLSKHRLKAVNLVEYCDSDSINKTFMSRLLGDNKQDFKLSKLEGLIEAINKVEPHLNVADLVSENGVTKQVRTVTEEDLLEAVGDTIHDLTDLEWINIDSSVKIEMLYGFIAKNIIRQLPQGLFSGKQEACKEKKAV